MNIQESGEMYLETILVLSKKTNEVRSIDVAAHMNFSKPSVSRAVGKLKEDGLITVSSEGYLNLTETGRSLAEKIYERHTLLTALFTDLGVSEATAVADACKIEHDLSDETFEAIKRHIQNSHKIPRK